MLYSEQGDYKLHVVSSNPAPVQAGLPKRVILTVNHVTPWTSMYDGLARNGNAGRLYPKSPPSEDEIKRMDDWKIAGDKRTWRVHHVEQLQKPAVKSREDRVVSYLFILEHVFSGKELLEVPPAQEVKHLRRFNNLILEDEV